VAVIIHHQWADVVSKTMNYVSTGVAAPSPDPIAALTGLTSPAQEEVK
jgi:hypothetical protein